MRFLERIHKNITIDHVMSIAKASEYHEARFVIDHNDRLHSGDGGKFMHCDISNDQNICGYLLYNEKKDSFSFRTYERVSHIVLDGFIARGVKCLHRYTVSENVE